MASPNHCDKCGSQLSDEGRCHQCLASKEHPYESSIDATAPTYMMSSELTDQTATDSTPSDCEFKEFGDYELLEEIARGGMGVVYKARHRKLNRVAALKMILGGRISSEDDLQRFHIEAKAAAGLDHTGIVPVYEIGEHDGLAFFAMKYIDGGSLAQNVDRFRADTKAAAQMLASVARAVNHAHQRGILHRDLKPANILIDQSGQPLITDLGLAKTTTGDSELTKTGAVFGTPSYMSPEQPLGTEFVTTAADIYAVGAIMYDLLTGRPPHTGKTAFETVMSVRNNTPPTPRKLNPQVDSELELICLKCIERNPDDRYSSAAALASDLENWLAGDAISVKHPSFSAVTARWMKQNRKLAYSVFAMQIGVLLIVPSATIIFGNDSSIGKVYEHFPAAERPWFMAIESLPHWTPEVSMVSLVLLIWPSLGLWNAIVTRPKSIRHAASLGGLTSLVCAGIMIAATGWLVVVLMTADYSSTHVRVLGEALWLKKGATPEAARDAANELFEGLDAVPEELRAKVLADRVFNDQVARGPQSLVMVGFMSWVLALPIFYGTVIAHILQSRNLRFWFLLPRYALAWLSVTVVVVLSSAYAFGAIIGKMKTDKLEYHVVMVAVAGLVFFLAMRRWRRTTAAPMSQLDSKPVTPAPV
jgi:eukaryotic-like serine/threonine-protein kinase